MQNACGVPTVKYNLRINVTLAEGKSSAKTTFLGKRNVSVSPPPSLSLSLSLPPPPLSSFLFPFTCYLITLRALDYYMLHSVAPTFYFSE